MNETAGDELYRYKWRALIGISLLSFVGFTDFAIVVTILPGIQADFPASVKRLLWVMNIFIIMLAMFRADGYQTAEGARLTIVPRSPMQAVCRG